jgi:Core-2/I-Branching enzyme
MSDDLVVDSSKQRRRTIFVRYNAPRSAGFIITRLTLLVAISIVVLMYAVTSSQGAIYKDDDNENDDGDSTTKVDENDLKDSTPVNRLDELRSKVSMNFVNSTIATENDPNFLANVVATQLGNAFQQRLTKMYTKAVTQECRMKIAEHLGYHINAIALEESLPFTDVKFNNECNETIYDDLRNLPAGMNIGDVQNRTYQPSRNESFYIPDPKRLKLLYVILTHDNPNATIRLIEALYEEGFAHQFVVHVDAKYDSTQATLVQYAKTRTDAHIVPDPYRVAVNWGGFSMVNATLQAIRYTFALDTYDTDPNQGPRRALMFHKLIHLSSSTYPIASNLEIRHKLSSYPLDANFLHVIMQPIHPKLDVWHYFVECDDAIHRVYQLPHLRRETHNINLYTSSQWFIISRQFAHYLAVAEPGSMVDQFLRYIEHVVVADETFFGTVLRHTKFCHAHHNQNFVHLQFDRWENTIPIEQRDLRKCPMPNPDHCGRSPTTMTLDYADIMELSADLFARKVRQCSLSLS